MQNSALLIIFEWIQFSGRMYAGPFWSGAHHLVCLVQFRNPFAPLGWSGAVRNPFAPLGWSGAVQKPFCTTWLVWCSSRNPFAPLSLSGAPLGLSGAPLGLSGAVPETLLHHLVGIAIMSNFVLRPGFTVQDMWSYANVLTTISSYIAVVFVVPVMVNTPEDTVQQEWFPHRTTPTHHWAPRRRQGQAVLATSQVI